MPASPHILCVLNPTAGSGIALQRWPKIAALLESFQISCELLAAQDVPPDVQVSRRLKQNGPERYAAIAGVGGDGTHSAVINGLMRYCAIHADQVLPPYVLIPTGTGNDMAKSFGLTARGDFFVDDLRRAVAAIRYGADYWLDLGCLDGTYFVNALTIGLDSNILREHNRRKQEVAHVPVMRRILKGNLLYAWCVGLRFWRQKSLITEITIDGRLWYTGPLINLVINNTRNYGGEFVICPDAYANDGLLDVVVFTGHTDYLAKYFLSFRNQPRRIQELAERLNKVSAYARGKRIEVRLSRPETAQYDGEALPAGDCFKVCVAPRALHLKIPAEPG
ncbi:MAG: diacylglycerol kinase family protein [Verrucomicrobiota bacterium]